MERALAASIPDPDLFKKLVGSDIWEFRTEHNGIQYRLLAFWDKRNKQETLVVATHGIIKKGWNLPSREIRKAERIRRDYFEES